MDKISVFFPHLICLLFFLIYYASSIIWILISGVITVKIFHWKKAGNMVWPNYVWRMSQQTWEKIIYSVISTLAIVAIIFYLVPWLFSGSFHISPSKNWNQVSNQADVAIIFGFGYGIDENNKMTPEASNQFLYDLAVQQTKAKYFIMQEGVYVAAINDKENQKQRNIQSIRMHPHNPNKDVNTYEAAVFAIEKMDSLNQKQAIVYAHNMQLKRAVADLKKIAARNPKWKDFTFIVPPVTETPFPKKSGQGRTKGKVLYRAIELYLSRVRDAWFY